MAGRKRAFPCGHSGKGQFCHQCANAQKTRERQEADRKAKVTEREAWKREFEQDRVDLRVLPSRELVLKARTVIATIETTQEYTCYKGKRLRHDRNVISVPLGPDYRLIFREIAGRLVPQKAMSHEQYNRVKPGE